jgi:glucose-6-phosphate 1-dehydrogenase
MAVVAMEPPNSVRASDLRSEQRHVLEAVRPIAPNEVPRLAVRAQYARAPVDGALVPGYREEPAVPADSFCDTFAALKLFIDNWRWEGVPFFLRTGKRMRRKLTQFVINFKPAPHLFRNVDGGEIRPRPNRLVVNVQPDEGISMRFEGKVPGLGLRIQSAVLDFDYRQQFSAEPFEAYATLLLEAIRGNQSHYKDRHEIEAAWRIVMPVLDYWRDHPGEGLVPYPSGSWGPAAADELIKPHGPWRNPETTVSRTIFTDCAAGSSSKLYPTWWCTGWPMISSSRCANGWTRLAPCTWPSPAAPARRGSTSCWRRTGAMPRATGPTRTCGWSTSAACPLAIPD